MLSFQWWMRTFCPLHFKELNLVWKWHNTCPKFWPCSTVKNTSSSLWEQKLRAEVGGSKTEKACAFISFLLKIPQQKTLSRKEFLWVPSSRLQFISLQGDQSSRIWGQAVMLHQQQEAESRRYLCSASFLFSIQSRTQASGMVLSTLSVKPFTVNLNLGMAEAKRPSYVYLEAALLGESRFSQVGKTNYHNS